MITRPRQNNSTTKDDIAFTAAAAAALTARIRHENGAVHHQCFNDLHHLVSATDITTKNATNATRHRIQRQR